MGAVTLVFAACSEVDKPAELRVPVALTYRTVQAVDTRAAQNLNDGQFSSGEAIAVRISNHGAGEWQAFEFTTGEAGAMVAGDPAPFYPAGDTNIDIAARYPASAGTSFSVQTDQTSDEAYKASDLMFASVADQAKQAGPVALTFSHIMAKINVNITPGSGVSSIESVSILNVKPMLSFDPTTGMTGEADGSATSIVITNDGAALIPAQIIDGGLLSIVTDQGTAIYTVNNKVFEAGKQYTLKITGWESEDTPTVLNVTADHTGWIITADGYIYENKEAVDAAGKEGVALIFYVGEPGHVNGGTNYRGLAIALSGTDKQSAWGYDKDDDVCLEDQFTEYSKAVSYLDGDVYGLQNTMNLSTHTHIGGTGDEMENFAAKRAMNYEPKAPVGTSGWFLGSMVQWDLYLRECCHITTDAESMDADPDAGPDAACIMVSSTLRSLGAPFVAAGFENPFLPMFYSEDTYYGIWTSTEVNKSYAWGILLDEESVIDWDDDDDPGSGSDQMEAIVFTGFTKGQGLHIYPFLAF